MCTTDQKKAVDFFCLQKVCVISLSFQKSSAQTHSQNKWMETSSEQLTQCTNDSQPQVYEEIHVGMLSFLFHAISVCMCV